MSDPASHTVLHGERVVLRPLTAEDIPRAAEIVAHPEVSPWWNGYDAPKLRAELLDDEDVTSFGIELEGRFIGFIAYSEEKDPGYRHAGVDLALDGEHLGQGLGTDALRTVLRYLFEVLGHHRATIDPAAANPRAIAAYTKVGFRPVGIMRRYERGPDGEWRDGLLMDLLAEELR